jgi:hypothetical protein
MRPIHDQPDNQCFALDIGQSDWIAALGPPEFVETVKERIKQMSGNYL